MMKKAITTLMLAVMAILSLPILAWAAKAIDVDEIVNIYQTTGWLGLVSLLLTVLISVLKNTELQLFQKIPQRLRILVPLVLGCVVGLIDKYVLSGSWGEAIYFALSGPGAIVIHEFLNHSILGVGHKSRK